MDRIHLLATWRSLRTQLALRRRLVMAALAGVAVLSGLHVLRPAPVATREIWVAARDLPGGRPLTSTDLRLEAMPPTDAPTGAFPPDVSMVGRLLAAPVRSGEPLTDVRLLSPSLLSATDQPDDVAVPVRIADGPATLALVHVGDLVNVIAAGDPGDGTPAHSSTVVHDVRVLATPAQDVSNEGGADSSGALLIVAATNHQAAALAGAAAGSRLSIAVRRQP